MTDYVSELAEETFRQIQPNEKKALPESELMRANEKKALLESVLKSSFKSEPLVASALAGELQSRADVQAHLASLTEYTPSKWLLKRELDQVEQRRAKVLKLRAEPATAESTADTYQHAAGMGLMGLCFSGGGIRSATFNLGILQGLAELNLLRCFDYLSTVSGGGYIHQWFAAWSRRRGFEQVEKRLIPLPEPENPGDHPEPIRWLRRYSNYLTPQTGLLSGDTWVAIATWLRNTLLNQTILFSGLLLMALVLRSLASPSIVPSHGPAVFICVGAIFYLLAQTICLVGANLWYFSGQTAEEPRAFGQAAVYGLIVLPLTGAALLLTLLLRVVMADQFGLNLTFVFAASTFFLSAFALTVALAGGAPLCYLKTHHRTSQYKSVSEFWNQPKCLVHLKFVLVMIGLCFLCILAAAAGADWIAGSIILVAKLWHVSPHCWWRVVLVVAPPLILGGPLVTLLLVIGLLGRVFDDSRREWLTRLGGCIGFVCVLWMASLSFALFGHSIVVSLWTKTWRAGIPALTGWVTATVGGLLAGKSSKSTGAQSDEQPRFSAIELLSVAGPYVFIVGLLLLISALAEVVFGNAVMHGHLALIAAYAVPLVICLLFSWRVDINEFSLHAFYRNRLARCYLGASNTPRKKTPPDCPEPAGKEDPVWVSRHPNPFTGFDETDTNIPVSDLLPGNCYNGPFPIFCTTLNLTFGEDLAWQERKGASFAITPLYSGYDVPWTEARGHTNLRFNGFVETATYAYPKPGIHVDTAVAISGAAVSPNMGYHSNPATAFLMTVFSVRLGWWLLNPRVLNEDGTTMGTNAGEREDGKLRRLFSAYPWPSPRFSLLWLANELLGRTDDTKKYVYLSDGGHFDNMGLYELVRRRCRYIVICDSEADGGLTFDGIGMAIRKCRIDFGAEIDLDLRPTEHAKDSECSSEHCVVGSITYPEDFKNPKYAKNPGIVVYIKSSLTGDEPADVLNYKKEDSAFPHDSTLNQWFSESQFESYRRLGHHVALSVFEPAGASRPGCVCGTIPGREGYFKDLRQIWWAPTPEMDRFSADHSKRYAELLEKVRTDKDIPDFFDMAFGNESGSKIKSGEKQFEPAVRFAAELIEFIFTVFNQLDLVLLEKQNHPFARGWSVIFKKWAKIDAVQEGWNRYRGSYLTSFKRFAESDAVGLRDDKRNRAG